MNTVISNSDIKIHGVGRTTPRTKTQATKAESQALNRIALPPGAAKRRDGLGRERRPRQIKAGQICAYPPCRALVRSQWVQTRLQVISCSSCRRSPRDGRRHGSAGDNLGSGLSLGRAIRRTTRSGCMARQRLSCTSLDCTRCYENGDSALRRTLPPRKDHGQGLHGACAGHGTCGRVGGRARQGPLGHGGETTAGSRHTGGSRIA